MASTAITLTITCDASSALRSLRKAKLATFRLYGVRRFFMVGWWMALFK